MNEILDSLDRAVDLLSQEYRGLSAERTIAFKNGHEQECITLDARREQVKSLIWHIQRFQETVAPDLYLES